MEKKKRVEVEKQKIRFVDGAVKNGIRKDVAAGIFLKIEPFAEYGFNKSHAAAYAIIAYQTAYLKTYFQNEFFAASMTMDISNQKKLGEFYEEIKRLGIKIIRPDINCCFADFRSFNSEFFYALGAIKNVGFEAISNVVEERENNGKFKSIADFIRRVNPKDINKLQLEGLVKAGVFDSLNQNRASLLESIPNLIQKSKNFFDNKSLSQINLFENPEEKDLDILSKIDDWKFEDRLNKEFEAIGFFVSDHPLNQFSEIYNQYKILNFNEFFENKNLHEGNVLATVLKVQEKKTSKGLSYAIIKFSDLKGVFELFIFSEILERNRSILVEGKSLFLSLIKNIDKDKKNLRVNIRNINLINDLLNKPIEKIEIDLKNIEDFTNLSSYLMEQGNTEVCINYLTKDKNVKFVLENKRKVDLNTVKLLKNLNISLNIF